MLAVLPTQAQPPDPVGADPTAAEPAPVLAQPGQVKLELSPQQITVGGRVTAVVTAVWMGAEPSEPARFPTWQESWGQAEVVTADEPTGSVDPSGRHVYRQTLQLTAWEAGEITLPAVTVAIPLGDSTVELKSEGGARFEVVSVLDLPEEDPAENLASTDPAGADPAGPGGSPDGEAAAEPQPRPSAEVRSLGTGWIAFWATSAGLLCLLIPSLALLVRRLAEQSVELGETEAPDPLTLLPPLDELVERLARLDSGQPEPAHTGLSLALRRFLARHLDFPAVESTTTEIQRHLRRQTLPAELGQGAVQLLRDCDLVKFGGQRVEMAVTAQRLENARGLGRRIDALLGPKLPPGANDAGSSSPGSSSPGNSMGSTNQGSNNPSGQPWRASA